MTRDMNRRSFIKTGALLGAGALFPRHPGLRGPAAVKTTLSIVIGAEYGAAARRAVDLLGGMHRFVPEGSRVAILANPQRNNPGAYTKPAIVGEVIRMCQEAGAGKVACISWQPEKNWIDTGLAGAVRDAGATLEITDLRDESLFKPVPVPRGSVLSEARIMKALDDYDLFIDMPITKDHAGNKFTGTLKNLMGLNSPQSNRTFHKPDWKTNPDSIAHLDQCIAELNTVLTPALCVVDATEFITTNGPFGPGELLKPQKIIAGTDRVAVDSQCCRLWGLHPKDILTIQKAEGLGLGSSNPEAVRIREEQI